MDPILSPILELALFTAHPSLKWLTFAQCKHDPKVKAMRMNGMQIRQICQILLLSCSFGKTQMLVSGLMFLLKVKLSVVSDGQQWKQGFMAALITFWAHNYPRW